VSAIARIVDVSPAATLRLPQGSFAATSFVIEEAGVRGEHLALALGGPGAGSLMRISSACVTSEVFGCDRCDCAEQLHRSLAMIAAEGVGLLTYHPADEGYGRGLHEKIRAYATGESARPAHPDSSPDPRSFVAAALIAAHFDLTAVRLLSGNPDKRAALSALGIESRLTPING
jgi:GTP cyclohydrolase II